MSSSDVEHRVRDLLQRHAAEAPTGGLLAAVRAESRRRTRRARALVAAAALVVGAVVGAVVLGTAPLRPTTGPVTVAAPATLVPPSAPATVTFPLTPGSAPADVRLDAGQPTLGLSGPVPAVVTALPLRPVPPAGAKPVQVRGVWGYTTQPAETEVAVVWQEGTGQWFELRAHRDLPVEHLVALAKTLLRTPVTAPAPFTFALVPAGYPIDNISPSAVTFCPPDVAPDGSFVGKLTVMLGAAAERSPGRPVDVAGHPGTLTEPDGGYRGLQVDLGDGRLLVIQAAEPVQLPEADLIRFAAGITVNPAATIGQG
jgi:hypothetical protein